jgi:hypothetical protein
MTRAWEGGADNRHRLDTADARHLDIHQNHVGRGARALRKPASPSGASSPPTAWLQVRMVLTGTRSDLTNKMRIPAYVNCTPLALRISGSAISA